MITFPTIFPVTCHTDYVGTDSTFVVIAGYKQHGIKYISRALEKGARHIVLPAGSLDDEIKNLIIQYNATYECVDNSRKFLAHLSAEAAGNPAQNLKIYAITGTKGKSSTAWMLHEIFLAAGYKSALISSVQNKIINTQLPSRLTTPQPDYLHQFLKCAQEQGVTHVVIEAAAQAVPCHRLEGLLFDGVIFTNFSHEHLEFFSSMEDYFAAKKQIAQQRKESSALIINQDDTWLSSLNIDNNMVRFSRNQSDAILTIESSDPLAITISIDGTIMTIKNRNLVGEFNAYNLTAAAVQALYAGISSEIITKALSSISAIPGRMVPFNLPNGATAFIDHAHNPASFESVLSFLRTKADKKLIVLFGTGGERDAQKRPLMGEVVSRFADHIILTTDNPRSEDPEKIVQDILAGIEQKANVHIEYNRTYAIEYAYALAGKGDIIALLGKGCDEYQQVGEVIMPFSEAQILRSL